MDARYQPRGGAFVAKGHNDTAPCLRLGNQAGGQGVGEKSRQGDGQDDVSEV